MMWTKYTQYKSSSRSRRWKFYSPVKPDGGESQYINQLDATHYYSHDVAQEDSGFFLSVELLFYAFYISDNHSSHSQHKNMSVP